MTPSIIPMVVTATLLFSAISSTKNVLAQTTATVYHSCNVPNTVALTFESGPYIYLNEIADTLVAAGAKGTFFFAGNNYDCIYNQDTMDRVKYAFSQGHQIASNTWSHKDLANLPKDRINEEMLKVEQAIQRITGVQVAFTRPPYGSYNKLVLDVAGERGQGIALWDFGIQDQAGATPAQSKALVDDLVNQHPNTALVLAAETLESTARQVLPYAISKLQGAGYRLVTLAECLGRPAYQDVGPPSIRDPSWTC